MKKTELMEKIAKLAAEAALVLHSLGDITPEEAEIVIWLLVDEILLMTREVKGGVTTEK